MEVWKYPSEYGRARLRSHEQREVASQIYSVSPLDPLTFAGVGLALLVVAFSASYIPAYRAAKIDPMVALRYE